MTRSKLLAITALISCSHRKTLPAEKLSPATIECYSLSYSDPVRDAHPNLFPTSLTLLPGVESGAAKGRPGSHVSDWAAITLQSDWKRIPGDSIEVMFGGRYEAISIRVTRVDSQIVGRATWLSDVIDGGPNPSLHVVGARMDCATQP
jgi:hypothetical protein